MFDFSNHSTKSKDYDDLNKLGNGKLKDERGGVVIEEFVELQPKMYSFLVDGHSWNVVATISYNEYKDLLLNNKWGSFSDKNFCYKTKTWYIRL